MKSIQILSLVFLVFVTACQQNADVSEQENETNKKTQGPLFELVNREKTGITFSNTITEDDSLNVITYDYFYNGGGVALIDVNNDGLQDIFFAGNQVKDELYLNEGDFKFRNVTDEFGINASKGWSSGAVTVDINSDGWMDLYVCKTGPSKSNDNRTNQLFINQSGSGFIEAGAEFGLNHVGHSSTAAFFDADLDGDLDCYILTHPGVFQNQVKLSELEALKASGELESDAFYENIDGKYALANEKFGIQDYAFGLGLAIEDVNLDGWPDIYVSNDFDEGDLLYINKKGKFENEITLRLKHTSNYGMGCDIADFNNDLWPDIMTTDMAFENHQRAKRNMASMDPERFEVRLQLGWHYQYMNNTLQLNNADGTFSDIAQVSGVNKTDWSWAALFADFDNDGLQDIFVSNGYKRDTKDNDLKANVTSYVQDAGSDVSVGGILNLIPSSKFRNYVFKNEDGYSFSRMNDTWGLNEKVNSNGAAYGDLDNDGDLDLILNNIDEKAFVYQNTSENNWLVFELNEEKANGARIRVYADGKVQQRYIQHSRGYLSSVDARAFFGMGEIQKADSVIVFGPNGVSRTYQSLSCNQVHSVDYQGDSRATLRKTSTSQFANIEAQSGLRFRHQESKFNDFEKEVLLPHRLSTEGPGLAVGDINADGFDDVWIGGASGQSGVIYLQLPNGDFKLLNQLELAKNANQEDVSGVWFDADTDGDLDLYVVSGSSEFGVNSELLRDRLYLNDGNGNLSFGSNRIPAFKNMGSCVIAIDIDSDDDLDLVIGTRGIPGAYPTSKASLILENNSGLFKDVTAEIAPGFIDLGMVKDITVADLDADGDEDLVVVGEFMEPKAFMRSEKGFTLENRFPDDLQGWWQTAVPFDADGDGDLDLLLGNIGENNKFHPSAEKPLFCYAEDFDENGTLDIVLAKYEGDVLYPVRGKECSSEQMPFISQKFKTFKSFAESDLASIYTPGKLEKAMKLEAKTFSSAIAYNDGQGNFTISELPVKAQFAPINSAIPIDLNEDGKMDLICNGNFFGTEVETTRYDAGNGLVLMNLGNAEFDVQLTAETGLSLPWDTRKSAILKGADNQQLIIVVSNGNKVTLVRINENAQ
ncbi:MAG: hypothetical protein ACI898_001130 [Flavobacteriales bacterium]|jgi:hypothetical protein